MSPLAPPFGSPRSGKRGMVPRLPILGTVSDLAAGAGNAQAVLTWSPVVGAIGYEIQYKLASSGTWSDYFGEVTPYYVTPPSITGLTNDEEYDFRVVAYDRFGTTTGNEVSATPSAPGGAMEVTDLAVSDETQSDELTFEFTQCGDGTGSPAQYYVRIRTPTLSYLTWGEVANSQILIDSDLAIGVTKSVTFTGLAAGTDYEALLIPFRGGPPAEEFGDFSNSAPGTTAGAAALGTIADLSASPGDEQVLLSWTPAENATGHQPQYKLASSGTWLNFGSQLGAGASSVTVTGLTNDSVYDFRIEADDGSTQTLSNEDSATPREATDDEPAGFAQVRYWDGTAIPGEGWNLFGQTSLLSRISEGGLPSGNTHFLRRTYSAGLSDNGVGTEYITPDNPWEMGGGDSIYMRFWLRPSANWHGHEGDFNDGVNKVCYWGDSGENNSMYFLMHGLSSNALLFQVRRQPPSVESAYTFAYNGAGPAHFNLTDPNGVSPSASEATIVRAQWNKVVILHTQNSAEGVADGELHAWLNGVKILQYVGYAFFGSPIFFRGWSNDSIWGGAGSGTLQQTMTLDFDGIYLSRAT